VRARELFGDYWLNGSRFDQPSAARWFCSSSGVHSVPCIHDISYVNDWQERTARLGSGDRVHIPVCICEETELVEAEIRRLQVRYPVVLDNQANLWDVRCPGKTFAIRHRHGRFLRFVHEGPVVMSQPSVDPIAPE